MLKVVREKCYSTLTRIVKKVIINFSFNTWRNKAVISVDNCIFNVLLRLAVTCNNNLVVKVVKNKTLVNSDSNLKKFFLFATVNSKNTV